MEHGIIFGFIFGIGLGLRFVAEPRLFKLIEVAVFVVTWSFSFLGFPLLVLLTLLLVVLIVILSVKLIFLCFFLLRLTICPFLLLLWILTFRILIAAIRESSAVLPLLVFRSTCIATSSLVLSLLSLCLRPIKVLTLALLTLLTVHARAVPEIFPMIFEKVFSFLFTLFITRIVLIEIFLGFLTLIEIPIRWWWRLRPLISTIIIVLLLLGSTTVVLIIRIPVCFAQLVIYLSLIRIFQHFVGSIDSLELFLKRFISIRFIRVIFLSQLIISLFEVSFRGSGRYSQGLIKVSFFIVPHAERCTSWKKPPLRVPHYTRLSLLWGQRSGHYSYEMLPSHLSLNVSAIEGSLLKNNTNLLQN